MNLDMPWLWHAMLMLYGKYHNKTAPCMNECLKQAIGNCFRDYFEAEHYPIAHKGRALEGVPGPISFSSLNYSPDTGLMLQAN